MEVNCLEERLFYLFLKIYTVGLCADGKTDRDRFEFKGECLGRLKMR
jgi:hypothetical protein